MTDRELLRAAAKAAGIELVELDEHQDVLVNGNEWNPLTDDGDALRLAVELRMNVDAWGSGASAVVFVNNRAQVLEQHYGDDPERATRRAIVRAAAQIGAKP